jgi:hypothetical protein
MPSEEETHREREAEALRAIEREEAKTDAAEQAAMDVAVALQSFFAGNAIIEIEPQASGRFWMRFIP